MHLPPVAVVDIKSSSVDGLSVYPVFPGEAYPSYPTRLRAWTSFDGCRDLPDFVQLQLRLSRSSTDTIFIGSHLVQRINTSILGQRSRAGVHAAAMVKVGQSTWNPFVQFAYFFHFFQMMQNSFTVDKKSSQPICVLSAVYQHRYRCTNALCHFLSVDYTLEDLGDRIGHTGAYWVTAGCSTTHCLLHMFGWILKVIFTNRSWRKNSFCLWKYFRYATVFRPDFNRDIFLTNIPIELDDEVSSLLIFCRGNHKAIHTRISKKLGHALKLKTISWNWKSVYK